MSHIEEEKELKEIIENEARINSTLLTCPICYDELLYEDGVICGNDHLFCKDCVIKSCEVALSAGKSSLKCMADCDKMFSLTALRSALPLPMLEKLLQKQQISEIKNAEVEGLETCPHCEYAYIPLPTDKIFQCENLNCGKATCRLCKDPAHIPLRCDEVERPKDVDARKKIEEAMSEELIRKCYKCGQQFIKEDGCNKMTCSCGAFMCYICKQPVKDYSHFNGDGGTEYQKCPLFSNNDDLHVHAVNRAGDTARRVQLRENPDLRLVHNPAPV